MKVVIAALVVTICSSNLVNAQTTHTGTVTPSAPRYYNFAPSQSGQIVATLSWDNSASNLFLILVCGASDPITMGVASGRLDRFARFESGVIGTMPCVLGVSTFDILAAYRLNIQHGINQFASARSIQLDSPGAVDARLIRHAEQSVAALRSASR